MEYRNRYGDTYTFTKQEDGNVLWEGDFQYCRFGVDKDQDDYLFVDPSGGPFIEKDQMLSHVIKHDDFNVIVTGFTNTDKGFIIKTKLHEYDPNDTSHLADTKIIGGIINTSYDE
tara:strand:+ start:211 stop:555 length:345 start_codon:yes stop_codon:yes gene_type:complete